ncbi:trypsin-like serine peptidase [Halioxenophilus aromaticivorans]|uniref:Serine protease n=1 Tax=Halioxenophilus aromaticivorans TaxID=1306992 RepID=A0AAV3TVE6_9ALTE
MADECIRDENAPLTHCQSKQKFNIKAKAKIPRELRSILNPEPKPYKLTEIDPNKLDKKLANETNPIKPMLPDWFDVTDSPLKSKLPKPARVLLNGKDLQPLTVFGADDRQIYNDTSYPWGSICRVATSAGAGSGVIVGPRHVLTASHVVDWTSGGAGTVEVHRAGGFTRATAAITNVWYYTRISGRINWSELDEDYAVLVTDQRIGDLFGWMGTRTYDSGWDDEPYWWNIGYPGARGGGIRPTFQRDKALDEPWYDSGPARSMKTLADLTPGNSGGPMFGFWDEGPFVVAVVSAQDQDNNWCSGGRWLTNLVSHAISQDP